MAKSPRPTPREASIIITKLAAARRQLDAAIRMTFANEDELAIHTVAAAAYRILRDILANRGRDDFVDLIKQGTYLLALDLINGKLSERESDILKDPVSYGLISHVAQRIRDQGDQFTEDDAPITFSAQSKQSHWRSVTKVAAFLKHADRDTNASLDLAEVKNDKLLILASTAYSQITHAPTPEMFAYYRYYSISPESRAGLNAADTEIADWLESLSPSRRRRACAQLMRILKKEMAD
jgi:hypothetical protein